MKILIQTKRNQYRYFTFGFNTKSHSSMYYFTSGLEYFENGGEVTYATMDIRIFKDPKFWKFKFFKRKLR